MRKDNEKLQRETDAAFAFAATLLNLLILLILCGSVRLAQLIFTQNTSLNVLFGNYPTF